MKHEPNNPFMRETRHRWSDSAGELPAEFDRGLVELDRRLSRQAASQPVPDGLSERVYSASVSMLPARHQHARMRFSTRVSTPLWGQLAMAASVAVAFVVAAWFHSSAYKPASDQSIVQHLTPPTEGAAEFDSGYTLIADTRTAGRASSDSAELFSPEALRLLFSGSSDYLLDTRDLTHAQAVDDLHALYAQLSDLR